VQLLLIVREFQAFHGLRQAARENKIHSWAFHGEIDRPKVMHTRSFKQQEDHEDLYVQVTVKLEIKQSINNGPVMHA
jgi:hypothetical protein